MEKTSKKSSIYLHFFQLQEEGDEKQKEKMGFRNRKIIGKIIKFIRCNNNNKNLSAKVCIACFL